MQSIESAVSFMEKIANDDSHGYSQLNRTGNPDYDCSSLVGSALNQAGFNVSPSSTTRNLYDQLIACGFISIPVNDTRKRGDIFLTPGKHVVMCTDSTHIAQASIDENGGITGATPGDQTGREIWITSFKQTGWTYHLRYDGGSTEGSSPDAPNKYNVGSMYTLRANMVVRTGPSTSYRAKSHRELTADGQKHDPDGNGCLNSGTRVTCVNVKEYSNGDVWIQIPSGWVAAIRNGEVYIS